jgi:limonene-1,2-epoxide hydrolase
MRRFALLGAVLFVLAAGTAQATATPEQVVHAWSHALNRNDNVAAARLFALNARVVQPGVDVRLSSRGLAVGFNNALPCAGKVVDLRVAGARVLATFLLGERPKHRCDAPGQKAAALFVVRDGKIVLWKQVPVPEQPTATA